MTDSDAFEKLERDALAKGRASKRAKPKRRAKPAANVKAAADDPKLILKHRTRPDHHLAPRRRLSAETSADPVPVPVPDKPSRDPAVVGEIKQSISRNPEGLQTALRGLGLSLRYNLRRATVEWRGRDVRHMPGDVWCAANDRVDSFIRESIAETFVSGPKNLPAKFGRETWSDSVNAICHIAECDPFLGWLLKLPKWDGTERLGHWLGDVFTVERSPLVAWVSRFLLLGAVARTFRPGRKLDESPVLCGPQGCGKSTVLRKLLPDSNPEWFADGLHLAFDPKARAEALLGRVIVEASEMAGATRADLESLKAFLTRTDDGSVRLAYRRNPETMLRRCIIVGTTNASESLPNDITGNRRFVAIDVEAGPDGVGGLRSYLEINRDQLWAEALAVYGTGDPIRLPAGLAPAQAEANERHRRSDSLIEDAVAELLPCAGVKLKTLMVRAGVVLADSKPDPRSQARFVNALKLYGWTSSHERHGNVWSL